MGRLTRFLGGRRGSGGHGRVAAAAGIRAQAVPLCARIRPWLHTGLGHRRPPAHVRDAHGTVPPAQLRPRLSRTRARPGSACELVQRARDRAHRPRRGREPAQDPPARRIRVARSCGRLLRPRPRPRERRRDPAGARECLSHARERRSLAALPLMGRAERGASGRRGGPPGRLATCRGDRARRPERSGRAHSGIRTQHAVRLPVSGRSEDRDEPAFHR